MKTFHCFVQFFVSFFRVVISHCIYALGCMIMRSNQSLNLHYLKKLCEASHNFFKRLKQNFPIKYFLGDNRNAIPIQIWVSLIAWLLVSVQK